LALGVSTFYKTLEAREIWENGLGFESFDGLVYTSKRIRKPIPCNQKLQEHNLHEQFWTSKLLPSEQKGMNNRSML